MPSWYRCTACGSEALHPQPDDARLAEIYSPAYYEPWTWESPEKVQLAKGRTLAGILDLAEVKCGQRLLDVGCAQGEFAAVVQARGLQVFGVDLNCEAVERARKRVPQGTFFCGEIDSVSVDGGFDLLTMFDFIEHVREPRKTLGTATQLLNPGGLILISTPRTDSLARRMMGPFWPQYREEHLHLLSLDGLTRILEDAGLHVVRSAPTTKYLTGAYLLGQLGSYSTPAMQSLAKRLKGINRASLMHRPVPLRFGEFSVVAKRAG